MMNHTVVSAKANIRVDRAKNEVYVIGKNGKEIFRREKTPQTIDIAHSIYMSAKYSDDA